VAKTQAVVPADPAREINAVLDRASRGDQTALADARRVFTPSMWNHVGDLSHHVEREWTVLLCGKDAVANEAVGRKVAEMKSDLAGPTPTALERLLVDRIAACWLQVQYVDHQLSNSANASQTIAQADYDQRRADATHRRYLHALKTLAVVRRLLTPAVQVNIAERQVNLSA
jgi:hypothetical protein